MRRVRLSLAALVVVLAVLATLVSLRSDRLPPEEEDVSEPALLPAPPAAVAPRASAGPSPTPRPEPSPGELPAIERLPPLAWTPPLDPASVSAEPAGEAAAPTGEPECPGPGCPAPALRRAEPPECRGETVLGRCEGDRVVRCHGGRVFRVDCASHDRVCRVSAEEGAGCRLPPEEPCEPGFARCAGPLLELCRDGEVQRVDCAVHEAECEITGDGGRCVRVRVLEEAPLPPGSEGGCGPCGCPPEVDAAPVDEPLPVRAFRRVGDGGRTLWSPEEVIRELALASALLEPAGIRLSVPEMVTRVRPGGRAPTATTPAELIEDPEFTAARDAPYVPVVFVDVLLSDLAPRLGMTIRDAEGRRLVVVAYGRHWTTAAHEIGHFLTLPHTHAASDPVVTRLEWPGGSTVCDRCELEGDRICDTPEDPGRQVCGYSFPDCQARCEGGWAPDVTNLMSYYHDCRRGFSPEQAARMREAARLLVGAAGP